LIYLSNFRTPMRNTALEIDCLDPELQHVDIRYFESIKIVNMMEHHHSRFNNFNTNAKILHFYNCRLPATILNSISASELNELIFHECTFAELKEGEYVNPWNMVNLKSLRIEDVDHVTMAKV